MYDLRTIKEDLVEEILNQPDGLSFGMGVLDEALVGTYPGEVTIVAGRPGMGKEQPVDTPVLTPFGWRAIGELRVGEEVIGSNGRPTHVVGVYPQGGIKQAYSVLFKDGGITECGINHNWFVAPQGGRGRYNFKVKTLQELLDMGISRPKNPKRLKWKIPVHSPIIKDKITYHIHPYIIGVLIGDGSTNRTEIRFSNPDKDKDISKRVENLLPDNNYLRKYTHPTNTDYCPYYRINGGGIRKEIIKLGLNIKSKDKYIPKIYLDGSVEQRIDLLRGLMDTDGSVSGRGQALFYTTSAKLAEHVKQLVYSLGGISWIRRYDRRISGRSIEFVVIVKTKFMPFYCQRKKQQCKLPTNIYRYIRDIKKSRKCYQVCIEVDSEDGLYITQDNILTHNSSLLRTLALNMSRDKTCMFFSLEDINQLKNKLLCNVADVCFQDTRRKRLSKSDISRLRKAQPELKLRRLICKEKTRITPGDINEALNKYTKQENISCVFIDYLQLMTAGRSDNRQEEVRAISREIKCIATEYEVPIIAACQLNREVEKRENKRPMMSDLGESGGIENDADTVLLLYRQSYYDKLISSHAEDNGEAEIIIAKARCGDNKTLRCGFVGENMKWYSIDGMEEEF